jgi:hypothetical protein
VTWATWSRAACSAAARVPYHCLVSWSAMVSRSAWRVARGRVVVGQGLGEQVATRALVAGVGVLAVGRQLADREVQGFEAVNDPLLVRSL